MAGVIGGAIGCAESPSQKRQTVNVADVGQFKAAVANAIPGAIIEVADGDYSFNDAPLQIRLKGTQELPVIIRAKNRGKARFTGEYGILLQDSSYVTLEGFVVHNRAAKHSLPFALSSDTWLQAMRDEVPYQGSLVVFQSDHCRLTRLRIQLDEKRGFTTRQLEERLPRMHWINLAGGQYNRVDHCWIKGQRNSGSTVLISSGENHFRIDHNHFAGRTVGNFNGFETIRLGAGNLFRLFGLIEHNLFENCDGESEIISFKSSAGRVSHNTFLDCKGMVVARHANRMTVAYNFFLNRSGKEDVGGVRIHGNDCNVLNNYFESLTGPGLSSAWGDYELPDFPHEDGWFGKYNLGVKHVSYSRASRAHIAFNTWLNCASFLNLGDFRKRELANQNLPPRDWTIMNNVVVSTGEPFIKGSGETGFRWIGNIFWNPNGPCVVGRDLREQAVRVVDPKLEKSEDGLWRLAKGSPAIDNARGWYWAAQHVPGYDVDMDGQERDTTVKVTTPQVQSEFNLDVGADEYSEAPKTLHPLTAADVGPDAP